MQTGYDTDALVPPTIPGRDEPVGGADTHRHFSRANVLYLAPIGNGLTLTAGLFGSYIGYQSFYSRYNINYTRSYKSDYAPYFLFGVAARYSVNDRLSVSAFVLNGYSYLSHSNDQPSYGLQASWKAAPRLTLTQNLYAGPDQANAGLRFWRVFSDSIVEWKEDRFTVALAYDVGSEQAAEQAGTPRTFWMGSALWTRYRLGGPWAVALRPEVYWDRNGRMTGLEQLPYAVTTTLEYHVPLNAMTAWVRLEYRYDHSSGPGGGFYKGGEVAPGVIPLTPDQPLLIFALLWAFDS